MSRYGYFRCQELNDVGIRLNKERPKISVTRTFLGLHTVHQRIDVTPPFGLDAPQLALRKAGGFKFNATCTLTELVPQGFGM